jgi:hypothetical protein
LLAAVNNWALELGEQQQYARAIELLGHGRRFSPDHPTFVINDAALRERWMRATCHSERSEESGAAAHRDSSLRSE